MVFTASPLLLAAQLAGWRKYLELLGRRSSFIERSFRVRDGPQAVAEAGCVGPAAPEIEAAPPRRERVGGHPRDVFGREAAMP
jgi:hypothetical protein